MKINKYDFVASIIGRCNVGKSLLFNRLLKTNYSLISNNPGTTIDSKYGFIKFKDKTIKFIDNAAIFDFPNKYIYKRIYNKIIDSINNSNIILFIIDSSNICINKDINLLKFLFSFNKKILLIFNKIDLNKNIKKKIYNINFDKNNIIYTSSLHNKGIKSIIKKIFDTIINTNVINNVCKITNNNIKLSIIGKQNVGKSTLINTLLNKDILITSDELGTTKDSTDNLIQVKNNNFIFTDTAGIKNSNFFIKKKNTSNDINKLNNIIINNIKLSNIVIFIIDITLDITNTDLLTINYLIKLGKPIILLFNKCDLISKSDLLIKKNFFTNKLNFIKFIDIIFISALYKKNTKIIFKLIDNIILNFNNKLKINFLNKILQESIKNLNHRYINNIKPKLKFCNIYSTNPIKIIIFGKKIHLLDNFYKKYIINYFYKKINYKNIPIYIIYKEEN